MNLQEGKQIDYRSKLVELTKPNAERRTARLHVVNWQSPSRQDRQGCSERHALQGPLAPIPLALQ